jgi:hypothetical protein
MPSAKKPTSIRAGFSNNHQVDLDRQDEMPHA